MKNNQPNIILLVMDTVRADHCSAWGYQRRTTPFLEKLSRQATLYSRAIAPSSWTLPVHISLFTGLYPSEHGVLNGQHKLSNNTPLLAELLKEQGYHTAGFSNNPWASSLQGMDRGFDVFEEVFRGKRGEEKSLWRKNIDRIRHLLFLEDNGAEETNRRIRDWLSSRTDSREQPVFLFVNYMDAHQVYNPGRPYHKLFGGGWNSYLEMIQNRNIARGKEKIYAGFRQLNDQDYRLMINMYDRAIAYLDSRLAEIIADLDQVFPAEETLLIITSDHGDNFGEHKLNDIGLIGHLFSLHQSLVHVPLLVRYPDLFPPGERRDDLVQLQDIFPTIIKILDRKQDGFEKWWRHSLLEDGSREFAIMEYLSPKIQLDRFQKDCPQGSFDPFEISIQAIQNTRFKAVEYDKYPAEFYDLREDPGEIQNLAGNDSRDEKNLVARLASWKQGIHQGELELRGQPDQAENPAVLRRLRDLGYL